MQYPTIEEVEKADREQLCRWHRFLPSPGTKYINTAGFWEFLTEEKVILDRIDERLKEAGGFTPEISKRIGWGREEGTLRT